MNKLLSTLAAACTLLPAAAFAQTEAEGEFFRIRLESLLDDFDDDRKVALYAFDDVDGDGHTDLVLASYDLQRTTVYSSAREDSSQRPLTLTQAMADKLKDQNSVFYQPVAYLFQSLGEDPDDHLARLAPLMVWGVNFEQNLFSIQTDKEDPIVKDEARMRQYTRMVFKPHVGNVTFSGVTIIPDEELAEGSYYNAVLNWKLDDPAFVQTGFRGYKSWEAAPVLFREGFEQDLNLLNFSRWKAPEPVKAVSDDIKGIITGYYRGETIQDIRYVADCKDNERIWYRVVFRPRERTAHYALVCIAEGSVASVWDEYDDLAAFGAGPSDVWYGGSLKEFWGWKGIEFMAMWGSPAGLEIAVRWHSLEGTHYSILREYGAKMQIVSDDYQYEMAY